MKALYKLILAGLCTVILLSAYLVMDWLHFIRQPLITDKQGFIYHYQPGSTLGTLVTALKEQGYLKHPLYFKLLARYKGVSRKLQAGEYYFPKGTSASQLLGQLSTGKVVQHALTLIEGWNLDDVLRAVRNERNLRHVLGDTDAETQLVHALNIKHQPPEGLFYPDTYHFPNGMTDLQFLKRAHVSMENLLDLLWGSRDPTLPYQTPYDALIVASMIEKETAIPEERPMVASVIVSRLRNKMLLQIDPTVIYGITRKHGVQLTRADLEMDTAYNTYKNHGLPPTPIALPSVASLHAALHPALTPYLYFVATSNGHHHFSETLEEHNRAVLAYRNQPK